MVSSLKELMYGGLNSMIAHRSMMSLATKNIANANTPGYSRQRAQFIAQNAPGMSVKAGVTYAVRAKFILSSILGAKQSFGFNQGQVDILRVIEPTLNDLDGNGISQALSDFFESANEVSTNPSGLAERQGLIHKARFLAHTLNSSAKSLFNAGESAAYDAKITVAEINDIIKELGSLNKQIIGSFGKGSEAEAQIDQRAQLLNELSKKIGITVLEVDQHSVSVFLDGGPALLSSIISNTLHLTGGGNQPLGIEIEKPPGVFTKAKVPLGGRLGGLLKARDISVKQALDDLDQMAFGLANAVNNLHQAGFGLDGSTGNLFFDSLATATGAAQNIKVSAVIEANPNKIAAAKTDTLLPGDNANMLDWVALQNDATVVAGGKTVAEAYDQIVTRVANDLRSVEGQVAFDKNRVLHFETLRDSVSSVSIQEEMISLSQFEHAFQAASRLIKIADDLYKSILNMV
jgi:flagellar hook-associated protein 1 FlgK